MKPLTLEEFAQELRRKGDWREGDFADEILALLDLETEVAGPYADLCCDLETYAPAEMAEAPLRAAEWLGDRSNLLKEIENAFEEADLKGDVDDLVKGSIRTLKEVEALIERAGWPGGGDLIEALEELIERAARAPEEVEIVTYDL